MITIEDLNPNGYDTTNEQNTNLDTLLFRLNKAEGLYGKDFVVTSGLRSQADQARINPGAPKSKHLIGAAADIEDKDGSLREWVIQHLTDMAEIGFWFENFCWTAAKGDREAWVHFQVLPPVSGHRIFVPSSAPPTDPTAWSQEYDHSLDGDVS